VIHHRYIKKKIYNTILKYFFGEGKSIGKSTSKEISKHNLIFTNTHMQNSCRFIPFTNARDEHATHRILLSYKIS
jgi:hypothetical protein